MSLSRLTGLAVANSARGARALCALCTKRKGKRVVTLCKMTKRKLRFLLDFPLNLWYNKLSKVERVNRQAVEKNIFQKVAKPLDKLSKL